MKRIEIVVDTTKELAEMEMFLYGLNYPFSFNLDIYNMEDHQTYFYKVINKDGVYKLATD